MARITATFTQSCAPQFGGGVITLTEVDGLTTLPTSGEYYQVTLVGADGIDYGGAVTALPQEFNSLANQDYTGQASNPNGGNPVFSTTRQFTVNCPLAPVCDFILGTPTFPSPGIFQVPFTTSAQDGFARLGNIQQGLPPVFGPSPFMGQGIPGSTITLIGQDQNGCTATLVLTLPPVIVPTLTSLSPNKGPEGTTVVVTGTGLLNTGQVKVGSASVNYQVNSDTELEFVLPTGITVGIQQVRATVGTLTTNSLPFEVPDPGVIVPPVGSTPEIPGWTISWQLDFNSWSGEHTTIPRAYLTRGKDTYRESPGMVWKQTKDTYGLPLTLEVVASEAQQSSFDTLILQQEVTDSTQAQPFQRYTTLSTLALRTEYHHTGTLIPYVPQSYQDKWSRVLDPTQVAATFEKDQYHLEIPGSVVVDIDGDIASPTNQDTTRTFKPRLSGKWSLLTLSFAGTTTQKYLLHTLRVVSRPISR